MKKWGMFSYLVAQLLDVYTTYLPSKGVETNHFIMNASSQPVLLRLLVVKGAFILWPGSLMLIAYLQLRRLSQWLADCLVVGICLWYTQDMFLVVLQNWFLSKGWYN